MTKERAFEIGVMIWNSMANGQIQVKTKACELISEVLSSLPEFQEPRWIPCSERLPDRMSPVWVFGPFDGPRSPSRMLAGDGTLCVGCGDGYSWQPRIIPAPPVEEESELVKGLSEWADKNGLDADEKESLQVYARTLEKTAE